MVGEGLSTRLGRDDGISESDNQGGGAGSCVWPHHHLIRYRLHHSHAKPLWVLPPENPWTATCCLSPINSVLSASIQNTRIQCSNGILRTNPRKTVRLYSDSTPNKHNVGLIAKTGSSMVQPVNN